MMYRHTMTVYKSDGQLLRTIPDGVDMASSDFLATRRDAWRTGRSGVQPGSALRVRLELLDVRRRLRA